MRRNTMPTVTFTTAGATVDSYRNSIQALRALLASGEEPHGIPVTRGRSKVPDSQRFVLVELSNRASSDSPVTLAVDVTNAYVVAYQTGSRSFFLREDKDNTDPPPLSNLFLETQRYTLPSSRRYDGLQNLANERRQEIELGMGPLDNAISLLRISYVGPQKLKEQRQKEERRIAQSRIARSLIVVIQMVAEAARYKYIEDQVTERIPTAQVFCPTPTMLSYEKCWKKLSKAIQQSKPGGFLNPPVQLASGVVNNINDDAIKDLAIMLFIPKSTSDSIPKSDHRKPRPVRYARCYAYQNQTESHLPLIIVILILLYAFELDLNVVAIVGLLLLMLMRAMQQQM